MDELLKLTEKLKSEIQNMGESPVPTDIHDAITFSRNITKELQLMLADQSKYINREEFIDA